MYKKLFKPKTKDEEIEDMIRMLKSRGELTSIGGFGRDWYGKDFLYKGNFKDKNKQIKDYEYFLDEKNVRQKIGGPWNKKRPVGPGLKITETSARITYSAIPIGNTDFAWCRIENNRLEDGYMTKYEIKMTNCLQNIDNEDNEDNENPGIIPTTKEYFKSVQRPGLEKLLERAKKLDKKDLKLDKKDLIDFYNKRIQLTKNDTYRRIYNYFVLRIKKNDVQLKQPRLPCKFSNLHDYDSNWHADPLYERDTVHQILDSKLKDHVVNMMEKYCKNEKPVFNRGKINVEDIYHLYATNDAEYSNMMRTLALARAEEDAKQAAWKKDLNKQNAEGGAPLSFAVWEKNYNNLVKARAEKDEKYQFRLSKNSYSQSVGIDIPKEYFEIDKQQRYAHLKKPGTLLEGKLLEDERQKKIENIVFPEIKSLKISQQKDVTAGIDEDEKKLREKIKEHAARSIKKQYWPVTSKRDYEKSLYKVKSSVLIATYHLRAMLIDMKDEIFKENYTYMGDIKCEPSQFAYLKKWYEYVIDSIVSEMIDLVRETVIISPLAIKPIKYHFSEKHLFEPSGPRRRRGRAPAPPRTIPNQETNDDGNIIEDEEQDMNNYNLVMNTVQLDENPHQTTSEEINYLDSLLNNYEQHSRELDSYIHQTLGHAIGHYTRIMNVNQILTEREIYDIQKMPHGNHQINQWGIIKELCRRWDEGTVEQDIIDPRTEDFREVIGEHWPNNIPMSVAPERGVSIWSTHNFTTKEKDGSFFETRQFTYEICSQMLPAILAVLHKTYCWTIVNPVKTVPTQFNDIHVLFPGCEWFKRITLSLITVNTKIGYTFSPMVSNWLIPPELKDTNENFMSNENIFKSIGLTSDGYLTKDASEYMTNGLQQQIRAQAIDWAMRKSTPAEQIKLLNTKQAFNTSGPKNMTDVILNFARQSYISSYLSYLNETRQSYIAAAQLSGTDSGKMVQNSLSAQMMAGQTIAYQTMLQIYVDINWLLAAWGMASFIMLFAGNIKTVKGVKMSSICQLGVPFGVAASKLAWDATYTPEYEKYPQYITKLGIGLYLGSFLITSNVFTKLIDDSVEDENEFNVQRYLSNRQQFWKWAYWRTKGKRIRENGSLSAFKCIANEFIQQSRRFSDFENGSHPSVGKILCPNKPREARVDGNTNVIYFDVDDPGAYFHHREIESRTRARNIHYPPGMFFNYWGNPHVVVDDLETMYQYLKDDTNPKKVLNELDEFSNYNFEIDEEDKSWEEWFKIKEIKWSSNKFNILNIKKQFRIAYNITDKKVVLLSVAGKNYAQSIKNTIVLTTCCAMGVMGMGYTTSDMGIRAGMAAIGLVLSAENNIALIPTVVGAATYALTARTKDYVSIKNSIPLEFFSILAAAAAKQMVQLGNWFISTPSSISSKSREDILVDYKLGLLIPLQLDPPKIINQNTEYQRTIWGGKMWCPLTGRIFWFRKETKTTSNGNYEYLCKWSNTNGEGVKLFYDLRHDHQHIDKIEDGFTIEQRGSDLVLTFYEQPVNPASMSTSVRKHAIYIYKPSPMNTHLWFIKVN